MATFARKALLAFGVFFLACYTITLLLPERVATDITTSINDNLEPESVRTTSARCTDCITSDKMGEKPEKSGRDSTPIQDSRHNTRAGNGISNTVTESPPSVQSRHNAVQPLVNNSHSKSMTGGSHHRLYRKNESLIQKPECKDPLCMEYLTDKDRSRFDTCLQKVASHKGHPQDGQCHFISQVHRLPVALASYPGSGNTWLRGLLETATGICTGFESCDISMRVKGFAGENIVSGAVSVVKTHKFPPWKGKGKHNSGVRCDSAIVLVRNPLDAFIAEWNRRVANNFHAETISLTSHVESAGENWFGEFSLHHSSSCINRLHLYNLNQLRN